MKISSESALHESELRFRNLVDLIPDGIGIHREGKISFINFAGAKLLGASNPRELLGMSLIDFVHPGSRENTLQRINTSFREGIQAPVTEEVFVKLDGTSLNVEVSAIPFLDNGTRAMLVVFTDITQRKLAKDSLVKATENWEKTFNAIPDLVAIIDTDHRIVKANTAMAAKLASAGRSAIGGHCYEIVHGADQIPEFCPHARTLRTGREEQAEVEEPLLNGIFDVSTTPMFDENGQITGSVHIARDITTRRKRELLMTESVILSEFAMNHDMKELLTFTIDKVELLTESQVGFFHFLEADETMITLQTWSTNTLRSYCTAEGELQHYPVAEAGVWVDCVRERRPVVHNDYANLPHRKGLPEGHAALIREMVVPVIRGDKVVAILGVGNKAENYDDNDIEIVSQLTNLTYEYVVSKRFEEALYKSEQYARALLDAIPDLIFRMNREGVYLDYKANKEDLYSQSEPIIGKNNRDLTPPHFADLIEYNIRLTLDQGKMVEFEYQLPMPERGLRDYEARMIPNGPDEIVAIARDITERKKTEETLKKKIGELEWFNRMMIDRELKMIELKKEINLLAGRLGEEEKYIIHQNQDIP